jgi:hypothetical protein
VHTCSGDTYGTTLIIAPANISVLNDIFARFIVPLIAVERVQFIPPVYCALQDLKDSEKKLKRLHYSSICSVATVGLVQHFQGTHRCQTPY